MESKGFFIIYQPKYKTPSVFDLHRRGLFRSRPFVTKDYAYRLIASDDLTVKLQFVCLAQKAVDDPTTGERYSFLVEKFLIDLDQELNLKAEELRECVVNQAAFDEIMAAHDKWRDAYIPLNKHEETDKEGLKQKLLTSIAEGKEMIRKELVRKNSPWVHPVIPRLIQDFKRGLYLRVDDQLYEHYRQIGGTDPEKELIKKIALFQRVYDYDEPDLMKKPDGGSWKSEKEIWECWIGFAGSEDEAKRICRTMDAVFRPLAKEMAQQTAATN